MFLRLGSWEGVWRLDYVVKVGIMGGSVECGLCFKVGIMGGSVDYIFKVGIMGVGNMF